MENDFQIGWRLSIERYGLRLEELREITAEIFDKELIDYLIWRFGIRLSWYGKEVFREKQC
ncbi:hypothetical protein [Chryseobacterium indoltheticum]|uniref:hypothetical protein n=1 Tax=Chryseobacterium indoltheticum TaxID=254 RepID=UPI003F49679B